MSFKSNMFSFGETGTGNISDKICMWFRFQMSANLPSPCSVGLFKNMEWRRSPQHCNINCRWTNWQIGWHKMYYLR